MRRSKRRKRDVQYTDDVVIDAEGCHERTDLELAIELSKDDNNRSKNRRRKMQTETVAQAPCVYLKKDTSIISTGPVDLTVDSDEEMEVIEKKQVEREVGEIVTTKYGTGTLQRVFSTPPIDYMIKYQRDTLGLTFMRTETGVVIKVSSEEMASGKFKDGDVIDNVNHIWDPEAIIRTLTCWKGRSRLTVSIVGRKMYEVWLRWGAWYIGRGRNGMAKAYISADEILPDSRTFDYKLVQYFGSYGIRKSSIHTTAADASRIWPGMYLNDTLIDLWIGKMLNELPQIVYERIVVMDTLFYGWFSSCLLSEDTVERAYKRVSTLTKKVDIFAKDAILIPINNGLHWTLAMICNPALIKPTKEPESLPCVLFFDSIRGYRTKQVLRSLRIFLQEEWNSKVTKSEKVTLDAKSVPGFSPNMPEQENQCDCGYYLLEFFDRILDQVNFNAILEIVSKKDESRKVRNQFEIKFGKKKWFGTDDIALKRQEMAKVVHELLNT
mmetsp:Transcript_20698/g.34146  ORF Transcript_20698/g.34146 Transcript_20698/m.34146 type:complete len:495 (+) Transcript_20698:122-1606(+)